MEQERIDECMLRIAELSGGDIDKVFDNIFSFFRRKTDLYTLSSKVDGQATIGFPPGKAEKIVLKAFHKQWRIQNDYQPSINKGVKPIETTTTDPRVVDQQSTDGRTSVPSTPIPPPPLTRLSQAHHPNSQALRPPSISLVNGGTADIYHWTQTADAIQAEFPLQEGLTKNDLSVLLDQSYVSISIPRINLDFARCLMHDIDRTESHWHIDSYGKNGFLKSLILDLQKKDPKIWWTAVFKEDEKQYACQNLKPQQNITELAEDEQAAIHKTIRDHVRKQEGKLTDEEEQIAAILEKARDLPGSPFVRETTK